MFDLVVEVLGLKIRHDNKIEGMQLKNRHKKHAQYADDLWAIIKGTQDNLNALLKVFRDFTQVSNLHINFEKTQIVRLGTLQNDNIVFTTSEQLQWVQETKILGINVQANRQRMLQVNYENLFKRMQNVLNPWGARSATLMGKILIVNALMSSQAVYKFLILNSPQDEFFKKVKSLVIEFLWEGKKPLIAYDTLIKDISHGALKLTDLQAKETALKIKWVKKLYNTNEFWKEVANELLQSDTEELLECNISPRDLVRFKYLKDTTFYSIVKSWMKIHYKEKGSINTADEILCQVIKFNSCMKAKNGELMAFQGLTKAGVQRIRDVYNCSDKAFFSYAEMVYDYGSGFTFVEYFALIQSIPAEWKKILQGERMAADCDSNTNNVNKIDAYHLIDQDNVTKRVYWEIVKQATMKCSRYDHGFVTWKHELKIDIDPEQWNKIRVHGYHISKYAKLRLFQFKVLSKKLVTNLQRHRWDKSISEKCSFCEEEVETILHLLWDCNIVKNFWCSVFKWLQIIFDIEPDARPEYIILNNVKNQNSDFVNTVILHAKHFIYVCKCKQTIPNLIQLTSKIHKLYLIEKNIAYEENNIHRFKSKWQIYVDCMEL